MRVLLAVIVSVATSLATPSGAAPRAQVTDPSGDANGGTYWAGDPDTVTPVGSQAYADVTEVRFTATRTAHRSGGRTVTKVTGFTVTMTLTAAPVPPADATGIYRVYAMGPACVVGLDHYTRQPGTGQPRTSAFDTCSGVLRRTPLGTPAINGRTVTWTVPLKAFPKDVKVGVGTTLTNLHFEVYLAHQQACPLSSPGAEQPPCAVQLDTTFQRSGSFAIR